MGRVRKAFLRQVLLAFALIAATRAFAGAPERFTFVEPHMGTWVELTLYAPDEASAARNAEKAFARIRDLDSILSDYDPDSELSRLSGKPAASPVNASEDLLAVLSRAREISTLSDGAFDVTAGRLTRLWKETRKTGELPGEAAIENALESTGYEALEIDPVKNTVTLQTDGTKLDLGGIAKGYAAGEALDVLRTNRTPRALVAIGGDIAIGDPPPEKEGWKIGIHPMNTDSDSVKTLTLSNRSVSTSGDAEQFVEIDDVRYSHILDPRTGHPLTDRFAVTVIAPDGATADALATAVSVLGADQGLALIEMLENVEASVARLTPGSNKTLPSSSLPKP